MILSFDTSAQHCAAALLSGDTIVAVRCEDMARGQAERLVPLLEEVLREGGAAWADLSRLSVGIGPGNFTGIRISVALARGLSLGLGIPAIGVSLFDTTMRLSNRRQIAVPAPRDQAYVFDADNMQVPVLAPALPEPGVALSTDHSASDHVAMMARIAATRPANAPRPAPLYIKPADAAPSRDAPPVMLDSPGTS
ncbi:tRNA (adenosine(37)-N6)-threonylcarbamoyltransferase complex dimerization subunit type 1 TsaB [Mameliella alba]|nr:tRNA (adenosine(37)-N6)-threonylcarbamoyltransferase complex dimerization subunit type 1 TsaB [Mameliella alba]MBY6168973.1 tRNA (adenosine(37)-N6)-threonylcarbamoyltransferase complex dimerization subunit type 1 TsaB [Mameliella alba]MBY6173806.1 tRNA (adenosine(37)-N6)-threonylcarbamoyltransferase complex dimerization subunit type 1 TsaB [Mameliella alba]